MPGPLHGVRVVELAAIGPAPFLAMMLADLGAEVVRIDRPRRQDGLSAVFTDSPLGRGRRSIVLDLRHPDATEVALRLTDRADVLIEGFRPGVAERLGVGPEQVHARNPALVYGRMTGWGQDGPLAATAGHDITYLALSGLLHGIGAHDGPPVPPVNYVADFGGGAMMLAVGILSALLHARATGEGQVVDAAMTAGSSYLGSMTHAMLGMGGWTEQRGSNMLDGGAPNYRCYETSDGRWVAVGALEPPFWSLLVRTLGLDESSTPSPYDRNQWPTCQAVLAETFRTRTRDEWAATFASLDACVTPVLTLAEARAHPHHVARGSFVDVDGMPMPAPEPRLSATPSSVGKRHDVGADTEQLLAELGYGEAELDALRTNGVLG